MKIMITLRFLKQTPDKNGFSFSLLPFMGIEKQVIKSTNHFEILIGFFFWGISISWENTKAT